MRWGSRVAGALHLVVVLLASGSLAYPSIPRDGDVAASRAAPTAPHVDAAALVTAPIAIPAEAAELRLRVRSLPPAATARAASLAGAGPADVPPGLAYARRAAHHLGRLRLSAGVLLPYRSTAPPRS